jgi:hypothetical protein
VWRRTDVGLIEVFDLRDTMKVSQMCWYGETQDSVEILVDRAHRKARVTAINLMVQSSRGKAAATIGTATVLLWIFYSPNIRRMHN